MAEYQNIFTQVQVRGPAYAGVPLTRGPWVRAHGQPRFVHLLGRQVRRRADRADLSRLDSASPRCSAASSPFEIIGLNMWASVNWDPVQFVRQLPWLALEPPAPAYGLQSPAAERRRLVAHGRLLPDHVDHAVVGADLPPGARARHGHARRLGVRLGDLALSGAGLHPPAS